MMTTHSKFPNPGVYLDQVRVHNRDHREHACTVPDS